MKSRKMGRMEMREVMGEKRKRKGEGEKKIAYGILAGKPEGRIMTVRPGHTENKI
jgi:hypothetical protein